MKPLSDLIHTSRQSWLPAIFISVVIVVLHAVLLIHAGCFCGDEVNTINLANSHSLEIMTHDSFPVLLPLLISFWSAIGLGATDFELRLLGFFVGIGLLGAIWLSSWTSRRMPPLLSLIFFGLNGMLIYWTGYLRAYGLGTLLIVLNLAAMNYLLSRPSWKRTLVVALMTILSVQTLYQNVVFAAAICFGGWLICWLRKDWPTTLKIGSIALAGAISLLPYYSTVLRWTKFSGAIRPGFSTMAVTDNLRQVIGFPLPQYAWGWLILVMLVLVLAIVSLFKSEDNSNMDTSCQLFSKPELRLYAAMILLSSSMGYFFFLRFAALITSPWYFLPLAALTAVSFDLALPTLKIPKQFQALVIGALSATVLLSIPFAWRDLKYRFSNTNLVVNRLTREISSNDYIVVTPWYFGISFHRYYHGTADWDTLPPIPDHTTYRFDLIPDTAEKETAAIQPVLDRIAKTLHDGHRVWVVGLMAVPLPGRHAATPAGQFIAEHSQTFEPVDLNITGPTSDYEDLVLLSASGWRKTD